MTSKQVMVTKYKAADKLYLWFGRHEKKSSVARLEREERSKAWRNQHTPDQWRTPHKIRVSKLAKEDSSECK